jgi:predicted SAM-dependent methyltransferase
MDQKEQKRMNIEKYQNQEQLIWLNVASSIHVLDNFVNLDNHLFIRFIKYYPALKKIIPRKYHSIFEKYCEAKKKAILIKHDCRKPLPFPSESVDHILCSHFLEHVFPVEMDVIIADFYRVLKIGSTLHVVVPDLNLLVTQYLENKKNNVSNAADKFVTDTLLSREQRGSLKYRFLEFTGGYGLQHYWVHDYSSMASKLEKIGFEVVAENNSPSKNYRLNDGSVHILVRKL